VPEERTRCIIEGDDNAIPRLVASYSEDLGRQIDIPPGLSAQLAEPYARLEHQGHDGAGLAWQRGAQACLFVLRKGGAAVRERLLLASIQRPILSSLAQVAQQ
jgi:hypothetical protein